MYGYATYFSVPQVVKGLAPDGRAAVRAILAGLAINGVLIGVIAIVALGVSQPVTEVAIDGIADRLGPWSGTIGSLFILAALLTTYWSVSLALADMVRERTGIPHRTAWLVATLPSLLVLMAGLWGFIELLSVAAGSTAAVVALITVPMYLNARHHGPIRDPSWSLGRLGEPGRPRARSTGAGADGGGIAPRAVARSAANRRPSGPRARLRPMARWLGAHHP